MQRKVEAISEIMKIMTPDFDLTSYEGQEYFFTLDNDQQQVLLYVLYLRTEEENFYDNLRKLNSLDEEFKMGNVNLFEFGFKCWKGALTLKKAADAAENTPDVKIMLPEILKPYEKEISNELYQALRKISDCDHLSDEEKKQQFENFTEQYLDNFISRLDS